MHSTQLHHATELDALDLVDDAIKLYDLALIFVFYHLFCLKLKCMVRTYMMHTHKIHIKLS